MTTWAIWGWHLACSVQYTSCIIIRGTLGLCYFHVAQLMTHPAIYTMPFTLQLCYKPLGILQRAAKSQKFHISNHDELENLHNINFFWHRTQGFPASEQSSRNFKFSQSNFLWNIDFFSSNNRSIFLWLLLFTK